MEKIPLYIDCDGVIFDTIDAAKKIAKKLGYDPYDFNSMHEFFLHDVNWKEIIEEGGVIGDVAEQIKAFADSEKYEITILTKLSVHSLDDILNNPIPLNRLNEDEKSELYKIYALKKVFPDIPIIFMDMMHSKDEVVEAHEAILIEDEIRNFRKWRRRGTAVLFSRGGSENYIYNYKEDKEHNPLTSHESKCIITSFGELENLRCVKKLLRKKGYPTNNSKAA